MHNSNNTVYKITVRYKIRHTGCAMWHKKHPKNTKISIENDKAYFAAFFIC